jgi:hypothetical protein
MPSSTEYNEKRILQEPPNIENDEHDDDLGNYIKREMADNIIEQLKYLVGSFNTNLCAQFFTR